MVEVRIIMEGGTPSESADVTTLENSESLRQSLNRIFSEALSEHVSVIIDLGAGDRAAARKFAQQSATNSFLYVDLDDCKSNVDKWFTKMGTGSNPILLTAIHKERVFFMVQEMEAWILKQPDAIEQWAVNSGYIRIKLLTEKLTEHKTLSGCNVEDIKKPSLKLDPLFRAFYRRKAPDGTCFKVKYGKLKTAPSLLDCLDVDKLKKTDSEFNRFVSVVSQPQKTLKYRAKTSPRRI